MDKPEEQLFIVSLSRSQRMVCDVEVRALDEKDAVAKMWRLPDVEFDWSEAGFYDDCEIEEINGVVYDD